MVKGKFRDLGDLFWRDILGDQKIWFGVVWRVICIDNLLVHLKYDR